MQPTVIRRSTRVLVAVALVAVLAACTDDSSVDDARSADDSDQDQGAGAPPNGDEGAAPATDELAADTTSPGPTVAEPTVAEPTVAETTLPDGGEAVGDERDERDELDQDEIAGLLWMREEEQLAHDVYVAFGDAWGVRVFENISASEQQHIDITIGLLARYDIADLAAGNATGTFSDPRMQDLHDELLARGMESKDAALAVGATIEELDITDLRARAEATDEAAIDDAYARLERASRNHLRAFVGQLELLGVDYQPTLLADFDEIVSAPMERGRDDH